MAEEKQYKTTGKKSKGFATVFDWAKNKSVEDYEKGKINKKSSYGEFDENSSGGTPIGEEGRSPKGYDGANGRGAMKKIEKSSEATQERKGNKQPRTEDGQFTYNSVNGKGLSAKSDPTRNHTVNPLLTGGLNNVSQEEFEKQIQEGKGEWYDKFKDVFLVKKGQKVGLAGKVGIALTSRKLIDEFRAQMKEGNVFREGGGEEADRKGDKGGFSGAISYGEHNKEGKAKNKGAIGVVLAEDRAKFDGRGKDNVATKLGRPSAEDKQIAKESRDVSKPSETTLRTAKQAAFDPTAKTREEYNKKKERLENKLERQAERREQARQEIEDTQKRQESESSAEQIKGYEKSYNDVLNKLDVMSQNQVYAVLDEADESFNNDKNVQDKGELSKWKYRMDYIKQAYPDLYDIFNSK